MSNSKDLIRLEDAAKLCMPSKSGKTPHFSTLWRWCRKGVMTSNRKSVVRLRHVREGRVLYTTRHWMDEFREKLVEADLPHFTQDDPTKKLKVIDPIELGVDWAMSDKDIAKKFKLRKAYVKLIRSRQ